MIVEFCGSPGSGKTAIAHELYNKGYYPFRVSSESRWQRFLSLLFLLSLKFSKVFVTNTFRLRKIVPGLSWSRILILSLQGAMTHTLAERKDVYIKDQGFFQFGDWVNHSKYNDVDYLTATLSSINGQPDAVVFFNLPPALSVARMKKRGDYEIWHKRALMRGFNSVAERLDYQNSMLWVKCALCERLHIPYLVVDVDFQSRIDKITRWDRLGNTVLTLNDLDLLEKNIQESWSSDK
ncbi:AAA family ATPase [Halomonas alkalisoli]|uniref:AAA family ATPase n=1 Tax=Halomonas alkalisoli TaxID=2907158 RepID=UPI001F372DC7|nr:AAA family ATPase [Halomonas alkalisoli]